ncbi:sensor histidine kinase [Limosilactobacillus equigenerosi]|uniref:histidine kinase n=2 Tax=Limosilactobacillus TaxID=2742598 RepID=A0A0R1UPY0_9LACO|nr:HAMP domain-containing sensor histidine kinase [Limosilactobacillus equigenerosi]KRL94884.1 sensor histidine kinase [Limosilactobacillus equigenerosi DSM 18793 = JCM 14505]
MRMLYKQMLAFTMVIMTMVIMMLVAFISNNESRMYQSTWARLAQDTQVIVKSSIQYQDHQLVINPISMQAQGQILDNQKVDVVIYNAKHRSIYHTNGLSLSISKKQWQQLEAGQSVYQRIVQASDNHRLAKNEVKLTGYANHTQRAKLKHQRVTAVLRPYFYHGKLVTVVAAVTNLNQLRQENHKILLTMVNAMLAGLIVALIVSYWIARSMSRRITKIRQATKQVTAGDYSVNLALPGNDEFSALSNDFNEMTSTLNAQRTEISAQEERRNSLLANAAHELRTPLTTINGLIEGMQYGAIEPEDYEQSLGLMAQETQRLIRLVNETLDFEKVRTNKVALVPEEFDASVMLHNLVTQLGKKAKANDDEVILKTPAKLMMYADQDRIVQILFNILQNAIQFTEHGQITVQGRETTTGIEFEIQDTGIGMTQAQIDQIWERFYKADPSRMRTQYGETGLGMSIVRHLVELHHGKVTVTSQPNQGTTVTVWIPKVDHN